MNKPDQARLFESELQQAERRWQDAYNATAGGKHSVNRSGIDIKPLYTPHDRSSENFFDDIGFPGEYPNTRGIYASMHRGRSWTQRQLIGWGVPEDYNKRLKEILAHGATALSLIPCNSVYRGYDADEAAARVARHLRCGHQQRRGYGYRAGRCSARSHFVRAE